MAISYPVPDTELIEKLNKRLEEFRKLRIGYADESNTETNKSNKTKVKKGENKKSLLERFFFSDYK